MFYEASLDLCKLTTLSLRNRYKARFTICGEAQVRLILGCFDTVAHGGHFSRFALLSLPMRD